MSIKIDNNNIRYVKKSLSGESYNYIKAKKNNVTEIVWGRRTFTIEVENYEYLQRVQCTYVLTDGTSETSVITSSSVNQFSMIGYDQDITVQVTARSTTETDYQYYYTAEIDGVEIGSKTFTPSDSSSCTVTGIANLIHYTLTGVCSHASVKFYSDSAMTIEISTAIYGQTIYYKCTAEAGYQDKTGNLVLNENTCTLYQDQATINLSVDRITWAMNVTMSNYVTGWRYKIDSGSWINKSASYTITGIDYASTITIEGTSKEGAEGYNYGAYQGTGTFGSGAQSSDLSTTLSCTRTRITWTASIVLGTGVKNYVYSTNGGSTWSAATTSATISGLDYATTLIAKANEVNAGYIINSNEVTATYSSQSVTIPNATRITWAYTINLGTGQASAKYKIDSGSYTTITSNTVVSGIDYASTLTIVGVSASTGYTPDTSSYQRTYSNAGGSITISATRIYGSYSQGTLPTGVASLTCYRKPWDGSSYSTFSSGTIYYGDQFYWTATASSGYDTPTITYGSSSNAYTWTGSQGDSIEGVTVSGLQPGPILAKNFTATFPNATATLNGNSITSGTTHQLTPGSSYTLVITTNNNYYFDSDAYSGTLSGNTYLVRSTNNLDGTTKYRTLTITGMINDNLTFNLTSYILIARTLTFTYTNSTGYEDSISLPPTGTSYWEDGSVTPSYYWRNDADCYIENTSFPIYISLADIDGAATGVSLSDGIYPMYIDGHISTATTQYQSVTFSAITMNTTHTIRLTIQRYYIVNFNNALRHVKMETYFTKPNTSEYLSVSTNENYRFGYTGTIYMDEFIAYSYEYYNNGLDAPGDVRLPYTRGGAASGSDRGTPTTAPSSISTKILNSYYFSINGTQSTTGISTKVLDPTNFIGSMARSGETYYDSVRKAALGNIYNQDIYYQFGASGCTNSISIYDSDGYWEVGEENVVINGLSTSRTISGGRLLLFDHEDAEPNGFTVTLASGDSSLYVVSPTSISVQSGASSTIQPISFLPPVTITAGTGVSSVYLSTNSSATSGDPSGTGYAIGTTVYAFIVASDGYYSTSTYVGGGTQYEAGAKYRIGSLVVQDGTNAFGTVSATRNPYIYIGSTSNGSATIDGTSKSGGSYTYVKYNSSHTVVFNGNTGYYVGYESSGTGSNAVTVNYNQTVYRTRTITLSNITSNQSFSPSFTRYYTLTVNQGSLPMRGDMTYYTSGGSFIRSQSIAYTTSNCSFSFTGYVSISLKIHSIEIYNTSTTAGSVTSYGTVGGRWPWGYGGNDDRVITSYTSDLSPDAPSLTGYWLGSQSNAYHFVWYHNSITSDKTITITSQDSAAAYISRSGTWPANVTVTNSGTSKSLTISNSRLFITDTSHDSGSLSVPSGYTVSPTSFSFGDVEDSPTIVNTSVSAATCTVTIRAVYNNNVIKSTTATVTIGSSISSTSYYGSTLSDGIYSFSGGSGQTISAYEGATITTTYSSCSWTRSVSVSKGSNRGDVFYTTGSKYNSYTKAGSSISITRYNEYPANSISLYMFSGGTPGYTVSNYYSPSTAYSTTIYPESTTSVTLSGNGSSFSASYFNSNNSVTVYDAGTSISTHQDSTYSSGSSSTIRDRIVSPESYIYITDSYLGCYTASQYKAAVAFDGYSSGGYTSQSNITFNGTKNMYGFTFSCNPYYDEDGYTSGCDYSIYAYYHNASTYNVRFYAAQSSVDYPGYIYTRTISISM